MAPPIVQLTVAYGAGLWIGLVGSVPVVLQWYALAGAALVVWRVRWPGVLAVAAVLGVLAGSHHAARRNHACAARWRAGPVALVAVLHDAPGERGTTSATVAHAPDGCDGTVRLRFGSGSALPAGARVVIVGRHRSRGVVAVDRVRVLGGARAARYRLREPLLRRLRALYGSRAPVVEAMLLGRRDDIPVEVRTHFVDGGVAHLLAISGLHVGIVAGWLVIAARALGLGRIAWSLGAVGTWGYVALLGFPAPATRAATFVALHVIAQSRQRHPPASAVMAVAVLVVTGVDPGAASAVGAWLSVAAVWGTAAGPRWFGAGGRKRPLVRTLAASAGAVAATAPITAYAFGSVAPVGVLSNLVAIPLAGVLVPGVFASLPFGGIMATGAGAVLAAVEWVAGVAAAIPGGHVSGVAGVRFAWPWVILLFVMAGAGTGPWRAVRRFAWAAAAASWCAAVGLGAARDGHDGLTLHVLDVGQGDALALRTPGGRWMLIDAGARAAGRDAGRDVVVPFFRSRAVTRLEAVVVSHGDADHLGGVPAVLEALEVGMVLEPGQPLPTSLYLDFLARVDAAGIPWHAARAGDSIVLDGVTLRVLHPSASWVAGESDPNENSVVLALSWGCFDALLPGDLGVPGERALLGRLPDVDLLKVGHHGSAGSTSEPWLAALRPEMAVISVGRNGYGHPAPQVLGRLARAGSVMYRTDRGGTVTIRVGARYLSAVQGRPSTLWERIRCRIRQSLRSSDSSSSRRSCTPKPPVSSPTCSTTSPSPPR